MQIIGLLLLLSSFSEVEWTVNLCGENGQTGAASMRHKALTMAVLISTPATQKKLHIFNQKLNKHGNVLIHYTKIG